MFVSDERERETKRNRERERDTAARTNILEHVAFWPLTGEPTPLLSRHVAAESFSANFIRYTHSQMEHRVSCERIKNEAVKRRTAAAQNERPQTHKRTQNDTLQRFQATALSQTGTIKYYQLRLTQRL